MEIMQSSYRNCGRSLLVMHVANLQFASGSTALFAAGSDRAARVGKDNTIHDAHDMHNGTDSLIVG